MKPTVLKAHSLLYAFCLAALSSLSSCEKEEAGPGAAYTAPTCQITKAINQDDPSEYRVSHYDSQERLSKIVWTYQGKEKGIITYEYNPKGQLVKQTSKDKLLSNGQFFEDVTDVTTFEYNDKGQVAKYVEERTFPQSGYYAAPTSTVTWEYDSEGNRTKATLSYLDNSTKYESVFTYRGGNCTRAMFNRGTSSERAVDYEYYLDREDKQRPSRVLTSLTAQTPNKNMVKKSVTIFNQNPGSGHSIENSYDYNDKGFPIKMVSVFTYSSSNSGFTTTNVIEHKCR